MPKMKKVLQPHYVENFHCIGSQCEDNCCIGWYIPIDKHSYQKYRNCVDKDLRLQMDKRITRNRTNANEKNYAKIKLEPDGACPFLDKDKLCCIQKKMGPEMLSITCMTYPRAINKVNAIIEKSLTMSCPEAARMALLNPDPMEFDEVEEDIEDDDVIVYLLNTTEAKLAQSPQRYLWELRIFIITLLQNRTYPLWQRLFILGLFCKNLDEMIDNGKVHEIPNLIGIYQNRMDNDVYRGEFDSIPAQFTIQMELMKELVDERVAKGVASKRFIECLAEFVLGIQYTSRSNVEEIGVRYAQAQEKYYLPFMQQHEYILENYLVNYVFKNMFPVSGNKHVFDNFVILAVHYSIIKMFLIGMAGFHKENFGTEHVLKLIQAFSKTIEHNTSYINHMFELLEKNKMNTMAYMAILIKN